MKNGAGNSLGEIIAEIPQSGKGNRHPGPKSTVSNRMNPKRSAPRSKVAKIKDKEYTPIKRILKEKNKEETHKAARGKAIYHV